MPNDDPQPIEGRFANYFEIRFTETEFLIDFGQHYAEGAQTIPSWRVIVTTAAATTLNQMLTDALAKYDAARAHKSS